MTLRNGEPAPGFSLPALDGSLHSLSDYRGRLVVVNFWSAECPWAERGDEELLKWMDSWGGSVALLPIASNANEEVDLLAGVAAERGLPLILHDAGQQVADLYGAQTTPHLFVLDAEGILRYQGALDDITFRKRTASRYYLQEAIRALLRGELPDPDITPPYGCAINRFAP